MKKIISFILLLISIQSFGQENSNQVELDSICRICFDEYYSPEPDNYPKNRTYCDTIVLNFLKLYPKSKELARAVYLQAQLCFYNNQLDSAFTLYHSILKMKTPDEIESDYKYSSALKLAEIETKRGNYKSAVAYTKSTKHKYTPHIWCGNAYAEINYVREDHYAEVYLKEGKVEKAINLWMINVLFSKYKSRSNIVHEKIYDILHKSFSDDSIKVEFNEIVKNMQVKKKGKNNLFEVSFQLFDYQIKMPLQVKFKDNLNQGELTTDIVLKECQTEFKHSALFKLVNPKKQP